MRFRSALSALAVVALAACGDQQIAAPDVETPSTQAPAPVTVQRLSCTGDRATRVVQCGLPGAVSASRDIIIGGQGQYVTLASSNVVYDGSSIFSFDVTVQNLIPQTMGTTDGTTPDAVGVQVFFDQGPTVTSGTGTVTVNNPDGTGTFTGTNQPFFTYIGAQLGGDGILVQNETSSTKTWQLSMPATVNTFSFFVYVNTNVRFPNGYVDVTSPSPYLNQGSLQTASGIARSAVGNATGSAITYSSSAPAVASVNASTGEVTAVAPGIATITATSAQSTTGTLAVQVCPNLALGEVYVTSGASAESTCLGGAASTAEYTFMPMNTSAGSSVSLSVTGSGIQAVTGPPSPVKIPSSVIEIAHAGEPADVVPATFEGLGSTSEASSWVGSEMIQQVAFADRPRGPYVNEDAEPSGAGVTTETGGRERLMWYPQDAVGGIVDAPEEALVEAAGMALTMKAVPTVGDLVNYNTTAACSGGGVTRTGMVRSVGATVVIVADTANPAGGFTTAQYDSIALEFDTIATPAVATAFGGIPTDQDTNGRVVLFFTRAINELSPPASSVVTQGLFYTKDVAGCANGNSAEMIYMLVPDPTGSVNSNVRTVSFVRGSVIGTAGHELVHLINTAGRVNRGATLEAPWLEEAMASVAEELMFYRTAVGLTPRSNIALSNLTSGPNASRRVAAFNTYANQNFGRFRSWLQRPDTAGVMASPSTSLARRGFGWGYLRYSLDRVGTGDAALLQSLVSSADTGVVNLGAVIGADPVDWQRDFITAMYTDDAVAAAVAPYQAPSWNYRSVYGGLGGFPLLARALTNNVPLTLSYGTGGTTGYLRLGVPASGFATVVVRTAGNPPPASVRLSIVRTK